MQANQKIIVKQATVQAIMNSNGDCRTIMLDELKAHDQDTMNLLTSYHWEERGIVQALRIDDDSVQIDSKGEGKFNVKYGINIHYGCSDIDIDLDKKMTIGFNINLQTGECLLTGEYFPEREPDEL